MAEIMYLTAGLIVTIGAILQGSAGIGLGFVAVPLLVLIDPSFIPGPLLLSALVLTLLVTYREHRSIDFKGLPWAVAGRIIGTLLGVAALGFVPGEKISLLFGSVILLAVALSLSGLRLSINNKNLFGTGTLSGFMGTTSAIGGVPMALIYQDYEGPRLRGTLSGIFVIGTIISIISLAMIGKFGLPEIQLAAILIPGILIGFVISRHTAAILDKGFIRPVVLTVAVLAGLGVIVRTLF